MDEATLPSEGGLRHDGEPAMISLAQKVQISGKNRSLDAQLQQMPPYSHQSNGSVEKHNGLAQTQVRTTRRDVEERAGLELRPGAWHATLRKRAAAQHTRTLTTRSTAGRLLPSQRSRWPGGTRATPEPPMVKVGWSRPTHLGRRPRGLGGQRARRAHRRGQVGHLRDQDR